MEPQAGPYVAEQSRGMPDPKPPDSAEGPSSIASSTDPTAEAAAAGPLTLTLHPTTLAPEPAPETHRADLRACVERLPPEYASCPTFYFLRRSEGAAGLLGLPNLAAEVDCGLLPQGPSLTSLEQVRRFLFLFLVASAHLLPFSRTSQVTDGR